MLRFLFNLLLVNMIFMVPAFSQGYTVTLSGPTTVNTGTTYTYSADWKYNGSATSPPAGGTYTWTVYGGTAYSSGSTYAAIEWTSSGTMIYEYSTSSNYYYATLDVYNSSCAPAPSLTFSLSSSTCAPRQLSYTGTPLQE